MLVDVNEPKLQDSEMRPVFVLSQRMMKRLMQQNERMVLSIKTSNEAAREMRAQKHAAVEELEALSIRLADSENQCKIVSRLVEELQEKNKQVNIALEEARTKKVSEYEHSMLSYVKSRRETRRSLSVTASLDESIGLGSPALQPHDAQTRERSSSEASTFALSPVEVLNQMIYGAISMQRLYRGYSVRKEFAKFLNACADTRNPVDLSLAPLPNSSLVRLDMSSISADFERKNEKKNSAPYAISDSGSEGSELSSQLEAVDIDSVPDALVGCVPVFVPRSERGSKSKFAGVMNALTPDAYELSGENSSVVSTTDMREDVAFDQQSQDRRYFVAGEERNRMIHRIQQLNDADLTVSDVDDVSVGDPFPELDDMSEVGVVDGGRLFARGQQIAAGDSFRTSHEEYWRKLDRQAGSDQSIHESPSSRKSTSDETARLDHARLIESVAATERKAREKLEQDVEIRLKSEREKLQASAPVKNSSGERSSPSTANRSSKSSRRPSNVSLVSDASNATSELSASEANGYDLSSDTVSRKESSVFTGRNDTEPSDSNLDLSGDEMALSIEKGDNPQDSPRSIKHPADSQVAVDKAKQAATAVMEDWEMVSSAASRDGAYMDGVSNSDNELDSEELSMSTPRTINTPR